MMILQQLSKLHVQSFGEHTQDINKSLHLWFVVSTVQWWREKVADLLRFLLTTVASF